MNATHGAVLPHILAPTQIPPATGQTQPFSATETFLIEASRSNSLIDTADGGDFNAKWTNSTNFNLRRGDRISVEMCAFNAANAGGGVPTIELTGEKAKAQGETKPYCDNKVMLEVFFYLNNNNTYSVGFPTKFPTGQPAPFVPHIQTAPNFANAGGFEFAGINGRKNSSGSVLNATPAAGDITSWGNHKIPMSRSNPTENQTRSVGYSGYGSGFSRPLVVGGAVQYGLCPVAEAYTIFAFHRDVDPAGVYVTTFGPNAIIDGVVLSTTGDPAGGGLLSTYEGYMTGKTDIGKNFNGLVGHFTRMVTSIGGLTDQPMPLNLTEIVKIEEQVGGTTRIEITFNVAYTPGNLPFVPNTGTCFLYLMSGRTSSAPNPESAAGLTLNPTQGPADYGNICHDNILINQGTGIDWYRKRGGSFQTYNEYNIGTSTAASHGPEFRKFPGNVYGGNFVDVNKNNQGFAGFSICPPNVVLPPGVPLLTGKNNLAGIYRGAEGYRNGNLMKENNNKPYILTRNDFYGMGRMMPNMEGYMPYLKPQTAFILLDAAELFTDLTTLANRINDILHQRLPFPAGVENDNYNNYILNTQQYAETYNKGSSVIPYCLCNSGFYDPVKYENTTYRYNDASMKQVWDTIVPIASGGTIKIQPANFQPGYNFAISHTNKQFDNVNIALVNTGTDAITAAKRKIQRTTYSRIIDNPTAQTFACNNICEGNMMYEDIPKMMLGDCWRRLPCFPVNSVAAATPFGGVAQDGIAALSMPVVLNSKLAYYQASSSNVFEIRTQALSPGSVIFTNINWLGFGPLNYNWKTEVVGIQGSNYADSTGSPMNLFNNLADALRRYENYTRQEDPNGLQGRPAQTTFEAQNRDNEGWSVEMDLGQTDDDANMMGYNPAPAAPANFVQGLYPVPGNFGAGSAVDDTLANGWWNQEAKGKTTQMVSDLPLGCNKFPVAANPNNGANGNNFWGTGLGNAVGGGLGVIQRDAICPCFTNAVFGGGGTSLDFNWSQDFKTLRPTGKIKMRSRPTADYFAKNADGTFKNLVPFEEEPLPTYGNPLPVGALAPPPQTPDTMCEICDPVRLETGEFGNTEGSLEHLQNLGIPFIPYIHTDSDGTKRLLCAMVVANEYKARAFTPNTWEVGEITWGTSISVSASFLDNHAIAPMNGDAVNFRNRLAKKYTAGKGNIGVQPDRNIARNNFNYIYIGAPNPTFQFNQSKNRFEFINFQQDCLFSGFTSASATTAQQGEPCSIINTSAVDSVFSIVNPYNFSITQIDPPVLNAVGVADRTGLTGNLTTIPNQGIRDAEGGIGIWNIWLCPPDYVFPPGINPVNYWDQSTEPGVDVNWNIPNYLNATETNHKAIVKGCTRATREIWEGSLLYKLGFTPEQIAEPYYGKSYNRYNPNTYNNTNPNVIGTGVKPLILGNTYDNTQNPATNINFAFYPQGSVVAGLTDYNGLPKFSSGLQNNQPVAVSTIPQPLTATDSPILTDSPFYLVYSNICETNYQSGATSQPALFYVMRNFPNQGYFYGSGSNYYQICNQDRVLSQVTTEVRNPATGELAKLSPNSVLMYKIERDVIVPAPTIDALGQQADPEGPQAQPDPTTLAIEQLTAELTGERPRTSGNPGGAAPGAGPGIGDATGAAGHQQQVNNWIIEPDGQVIQQAMPNAQGQAMPIQMANVMGEADALEWASSNGSENMIQIDAPPPQPVDFPVQVGETKQSDFAQQRAVNETREGMRQPSRGLTATQETIATRAAEWVVRAVVARVPLITGAENQTKDIQKLPRMIQRALESESGLNDTINRMAQQGASAAEIVKEMAPRFEGLRFGRKGQFISKRSSTAPNAAMVFEGTRGRQIVRELARQITTGGDNFAPIIQDAIRSQALIGERTEVEAGQKEQVQFPLTPNRTQSRPAKASYKSQGFAYDPSPTKEVAVDARRTRGERGRGRERDDRREGTKYDSRSASRADSMRTNRARGETQVFKSGERQRSLSRAQSTGSATSAVSTTGSQRETKQRN